ncbi:hypothetical protein [Amycolatopsis rifamycinica]|uniref:Uncharacterized protein n=1 Tax=Amycolatopsis rifamycinica TaxID=287986 RepID=A0A066U444_9PSEU|nr:hypothetical protein DV20_27715 [Amycolatopsis rifamycinica]
MTRYNHVLDGVFALRERPAGLVSFGLGGPEPGVGRPQFEPYFTRARSTPPSSTSGGKAVCGVRSQK